MFASGVFSARPGEPLRADASRLAALQVNEVAAGFQIDPRNPMVGLEGRVDLLRRLGRAALGRPAVFARHDEARPGGLFDHLAAQVEGGLLPAEAILAALLGHLGSIWPGRIALGGVDLGDTWRHPSLVTDDATTGLLPFHKLSQWLAYSLIEPLQAAGVGVSGVDALTGLAEYRNGGLFVDAGVLALKNPTEAERPHPADSTLVVEWRALTVALLDDVSALIRSRLGLTPEQFPLAKALEGGTWAAGRRIAREKRPGGAPPIAVISDGTVF
jgi:hypothetical protein